MKNIIRLSLAALSATALTTGLVGVPAAGAQTVDIKRIAPAPGATFSPGAIDIQGQIVAAGTSAAPTHVTFVVDVSSSTRAKKNMDCNGDGTVDTGDDLNGDEIVGSTLDCEIQSVLTLNEQLAAIPGASTGIRVSVVPFGDSAKMATMDGAGSTSTAPGANVVTVAKSLKVGGVGEFTAKSVGEGTAFNPAIATAIDSIGDIGEGYVFFMTDGLNEHSLNLDPVTAASPRIKFRTYSIGEKAEPCEPGRDVYDLAVASGQECTRVTNPTELPLSIATAQVAGIEHVVVEYEGRSLQLKPDAVGTFLARVQESDPGMHSVEVEVHFTDDRAPQTQTWQFEIDAAATTPGTVTTGTPPTISEPGNGGDGGTGGDGGGGDGGGEEGAAPDLTGSLEGIGTLGAGGLGIGVVLPVMGSLGLGAIALFAAGLGTLLPGLLLPGLPMPAPQPPAAPQPGPVPAPGPPVANGRG